MRAVAKPIPELPPTTRMLWPCRSNMKSFPFCVGFRQFRLQAWLNAGNRESRKGKAKRDAARKPPARTLSQLSNAADAPIPPNLERPNAVDVRLAVNESLAARRIENRERNRHQEDRGDPPCICRGSVS